MSNRSTKASSQKSAALICGGIVAAAILLGIMAGLFESDDGFVEHYIDTSPRENQYLAAQMQILGAFLGETCPGSKILVIADPVTEYSSDRHNAMARAFDKGLADRATVLAVVAPSPGEEISEEAVMYESYLTAKAVESAIAEHPECDLVVSWIGLPEDFAEMKYWETPADQRPKMVLVNANVYSFRESIQEGAVYAAVMHRPDIEFEVNEKVPTDVAQAFDKRYLLITAQNIDEIAARYPRMFKPVAK